MFLRCLSSLKLLHSIPINIEAMNITTTYIKVHSHPNNDHNKTTMIGLSNGEVIKKDIVGPNGAPVESKTAKIGIVEQEQKRVIELKSVQYKYPFNYLTRLNIFLIFSSCII